MEQEKRETINLNDYEIDREKLQQELDKQMTGAVEFAIILKSGESAKSIMGLFATAHAGMGTQRYIAELFGYLLDVGILKKRL